MILHYIATTYLLKKKIYNDGYYFIILTVTMAAGILLCTMYGSILLRYAVAAGIIAIFAWMWRHDIQSFVQMLKSKNK